VALTHVLLFLHLLGAVSFFAGAAVAATLQAAAIRRDRPSEVYALLRLTPVGAGLVGVGALLTLGFGIALAEHEGFGFSPAWIQAALGLWVASMALGAYGGRTARHARHLAQRLAGDGDAPSAELHGLVSARVPLAASLASGLTLLAILVLMVWQPGGNGVSSASPPTSAPSAFQESVERKVVASNPQLAYFPTRLPHGYALSEHTIRRNALELATPAAYSKKRG
jgi:uncharacterized membrane protein